MLSEYAPIAVTVCLLRNCLSLQPLAAQYHFAIFPLSLPLGDALVDVDPSVLANVPPKLPFLQHVF